MSFNDLTGKEEAICDVLFDYYENEALAKHFVCSIHTIKTQLHSIYLKTGVKSRTELMAAVAKWKVLRERKRAKKLRQNLKDLVDKYTNPPTYLGDDDNWYLGMIKEAIIKRNEIIKKAYEEIKELRYALNN